METVMGPQDLNVLPFKEVDALETVSKNMPQKH